MGGDKLLCSCVAQFLWFIKDTRCSGGRSNVRGVLLFGNVSRGGGNRTACVILLQAPDREVQLESPKCSCDDNIKVDLEEVGWDV